MKNQFAISSCTHQPRRLALAIAVTLCAAGPLYAGTSMPTAQSTDQTSHTAAQTTNKKSKSAANTTKTPSKQKATQLSGVTVSGYLSSLTKAQIIKRYSTTVVDAISAEEAGNLPETSVTGALKRVPGVTVSAFGVANDPDHFSIQGSDISLEGLPYTSTLFDGREVFSAGGGEGLDFSTVAPQLIGSVVVKKNQTASMIAGGIAGSINLNTRLPFDS